MRKQSQSSIYIVKSASTTMQWTIFGLLLIAGVCLAEINLPPVEVNKLDEIPAIKERCEKKSPDSYEKIKIALNETKSCIQGKINPNQIKNELDEAKKTGSMDEVFAKYCNKRQEIKNCVMNTVNASKKCMEENEINALDTAIRVIEEVVDFACFNDGDRLAMFVAEGGVECVGQRSTAIMNCVNATLKLQIDPADGLTLSSFPNTLPTLGIDKKKCDDMAKIRECVVTDLENNCKDTTPANIVDALFKFINKQTCKNLKQKRSDQSWRLRRDAKWQANSMIDLSVVNNEIAESCKQNGGIEVSTDFWDSLNAATACFGTKRIFVTPKNEYLATLKSCSSEWIPKVEACLSDDLKYYPSLFIEGLESLIGFAYDHLNLNTISPKSEVVYCLQRIKNAGIKKNLELCLEFSNTTKNTNFSVPNKTEICKQWAKLDDCFNTFVKSTCVRDITIDRILANLTAVSRKPCKNVLSNIS